mgnify:CR=1 FL=1
MAEQKTRPTGADVDAFLDSVPDPRRQADARALCALMADATGDPPVLWGPSLVGFGSYHYRYDSGHDSVAAAPGGTEIIGGEAGRSVRGRARPC